MRCHNGGNDDHGWKARSHKRDRVLMAYDTNRRHWTNSEEYPPADSRGLWNWLRIRLRLLRREKRTNGNIYLWETAKAEIMPGNARVAGKKPSASRSQRKSRRLANNSRRSSVINARVRQAGPSFSIIGSPCASGFSSMMNPTCAPQKRQSSVRSSRRTRTFFSAGMEKERRHSVQVIT